MTSGDSACKRTLVFDKRDQVSFAWIGLGILFVGFLGAPLVHLLHVHGALKSVHRALALHTASSPRSLPLSDGHVHSGHGHSHDDDTPAHEHGSASLEHPEFLCAEAAGFAVDATDVARIEEALPTLVARLDVRRLRSPVMPQGP